MARQIHVRAVPSPMGRSGSVVSPPSSRTTSSQAPTLVIWIWPGPPGVPAIDRAGTLTIGEIRLGIECLRRKDGAQAGLLEQWLHGLRPSTTITSSTSTRASQRQGAPERPRPPPRNRGPTARHGQGPGLILVTRNVADLARSDIGSARG